MEARRRMLPRGVLLPYCSHTIQVVPELEQQRLGQHAYPVTATVSVASDELSPRELNVLHTHTNP